MFRGMPRRGGSMERPCDPEVARLHGAATAESAAELGVEAAGGSSLCTAAAVMSGVRGENGENGGPYLKASHIVEYIM